MIKLQPSVYCYIDTKISKISCFLSECLHLKEHWVKHLCVVLTFLVKEIEDNESNQCNSTIFFIISCLQQIFYFFVLNVYLTPLLKWEKKVACKKMIMCNSVHANPTTLCIMSRSEHFFLILCTRCLPYTFRNINENLCVACKLPVKNNDYV